jgi:hypothetical protein
MDVLLLVVFGDEGLDEERAALLGRVEVGDLVVALRILIELDREETRQRASDSWAEILEPCWGAASTLSEADALLLPAERREVVRALREAAS